MSHGWPQQDPMSVAQWADENRTEISTLVEVAVFWKDNTSGDNWKIGSPLAFHLFNQASLLVMQVCCSMKIDGLLLEEF